MHIENCELLCNIGEIEQSVFFICHFIDTFVKFSNIALVFIGTRKSIFFATFKVGIIWVAFRNFLKKY